MSAPRDTPEGLLADLPTVLLAMTPEVWED
jgi:hypothetical protein